MFESIIALLLLIFSVQKNVPLLTKDKVTQRIEESASNFHQDISTKVNLPDFTNIKPGPTTASKEVSYSREESNENIPANNEDNEGLQPQKDTAFNNKSDKVVGEVASVAIEKSQPLVLCEDDLQLCATPTPPLEIDSDHPPVTPNTKPAPTVKPSITKTPLPPIDNPCKCPPGSKCVDLVCPIVEIE